MGFWNGVSVVATAIDERLRGARPVGGPAASAAPAVPAALPPRAGFDTDVPYGGADKNNPGGDYPDGRAEFMAQLYQAYIGCPWLASPIDAIARTVTAGGVSVEPSADIVPEDGSDATGTAEPGDHVQPDPTPQVKQLQALLDYCNPHMDIVQLLRGVITDLCIYGDSFIEVVWLLGRPVALYPLDPASMTVEADEHGNVLGFDQVLDGRDAHFEPHEVIHISMDAPKGALYGMGIGQKALLPVTVWLFTAGVLKETMRKGDPPHLHLDFPLEVQPDAVRAWRGQYATRNLGAANIGVPITTRGGVTLNELQIGKIAEYLAIQDACRDTILSVAGVPPAQVSVIESGNLGGGTGTSQFKTFRTNTCGPIASIVLEKLNFALTRVGFGITGWQIVLDDVDWRDDQMIEQIRDMRIKNGIWSLNEARADVDLPPVGDEGDAHILALQRVVIDWADMADYSDQTIQGMKAKTSVDQATAQAKKNPPTPPPAPPGAHPPPPPGGEPAAGGKPPAGKPAAAPPKEEEEGKPAEAVWRDAVLETYARRLLAARD